GLPLRLQLRGGFTNGLRAAGGARPKWDAATLLWRLLLHVLLGGVQAQLRGVLLVEHGRLGLDRLVRGLVADRGRRRGAALFCGGPLEQVARRELVSVLAVRGQRAAVVQAEAEAVAEVD